MPRGVSAIDRELADYKIVASDLKVGVNHLALDEERIRQEQFFEGILDLQQCVSQNPDYHERYGDEVENLKNGIRLNADVLNYLKSITKLEVPLTDLTNKITQAAIDAGSPKAASPSVFANKALTENVNSCWEYIAQLSLITQSHLKDAAAYQQFHHMANEVDAHIDKMIGLAEMKMALFEPQGTVDESTLLAKELEADHVELTRTWDQICQLIDMARYMKPLRNRHSRVVCGRTVDSPENIAQQIVMVKALIDFSGPDFAIRKGEEMILMNNENPNFWRVKTTFGEREVPSLVFATIGPNQNEVFKANSLQKKCVSDWKRILERTKGRLVKYYATLFERYCQNDVVYFAHEDAMNAFLDDIDSILIVPNYDSGILHRAYEKFTNTLMLLSPHRRPPRGAVALTESDIRVLHTPLTLLLNQVAHVDKVQARVTMTAEEVQRYLKSVEDERQHIYNEIARMEQLQKENESQLKSLADRMVDWKSKRKAYDRAIRDYTSEPIDDILKHFPSTRLAKPNAIENDYRSPTDHYETDDYEPSNKFRNSSETPSSDYGQVAKQMVTSHARSKPSGMKFAGGVIQERAASKVWAGNAMSLKRSASTNDLQTQILRVTMSTSTQCNENAGISESDAVYNTESRRQNLGSRGSYVARVKAELDAKSERYQSTTDVQAQITRVTKNASSQVGVRVMPKAIDLSRVDIDNLGLEVQNNSESTGLGLRVGQVLCPVTVGTSVDLFEGPGVQVMGINDVDSINLQLRDSVARATTDAHRRLKVRDVQAQIFSRSNSPATASIREDLRGDTRSRDTTRSEVQAQIGVINKAVGVQAVATMEVVNIPSQKPKKRTAEGATTSFCLLPGKDTKSMGFTVSEPSTSTVMTQISCLLHSRGIHSDLESYLSDYKKRNGINLETVDLCTQIQSVEKGTNKEPQVTGFVKGSEMSHGHLKSADVETLICKVGHDAGTQVSSKLVPTEVTVGRIRTMDMEVSFADPLHEVDIGVPVDSLICPADMKFRSELYEGSGFEIADYSGLSNLLVTHDGSVARGSVMPDEIPVNSTDLQTQTTSEFKAQVAIVLRTDKTKSAVKEIVASSKYVPKLKFLVAEIGGPSIHTSKTPTSDLQTQISDTIRPRDVTEKSEDLDENMTDFTRGYDTVEGDYSTRYKPKTQTTVATISNQSIRVVGEVVCSRCRRRYREIQMQFESDFEANEVEKFSTQTQICNVVSDIATQSRGEEMYDERIVRKRSPVVVNAATQVAVELVPTDIVMSRCDIENMELEFKEESDGATSKVRMKSVACPARIKVKPHLVEGSGVHIAGINDSSKIGFSVCSATKGDVKSNSEFANKGDDGAYGELQSFVTFEPPVGTTSLFQGRQSSSKITQRCRIRPLPSEQVGQKSTPSDTVTQIVSVIKDASVQVGTQLVPQAIGIAPVHLKNMEISVTSKGKRKGEETLSASTLLYPAQVELKSRLMDEESGIEVVPLDRVEVVNMSSPAEVDPLIHYAYPSSGLDAATQSATQIPESKRSNLLPASLVMETSQFDGSCRVPELASQSLVCELLSGKTEHQALTIRAKSVPKMNTEYSGGRSAQHLGYLTVGAVVQTADLPGQKIPPLATQHSVEVQVGTRLVPKALEISQIPVANLKLEPVSPSLEGRQNFSIQAVRCPAEMVTKTELCENSGIFICPLDQSKEVVVEMSDKPVHTLEPSRMVVSGCWNSGTNKSMRSTAISLPIEGVQASSSNLLSNESSLTLQAEAILRPESSGFSNQADLIHIHDSNPQFKLVVVNAGTQRASKSAIETVSGPPTPDRRLSTVNSTMVNLPRPNVDDHGVQVGVRLVPTSVEIKRIKVEKTEAVLTGKTTLSSNEINASEILCTSGIQYNEVLTETSGVHVVQIDNGDDISLNYRGDQFTTSVVSSKKCEPSISSIDGTRSWIKRSAFSNASANYIQSLKDGDSNSIGPINKCLISSASQVGTLLIPAKVCMDRIAVDQLAVDIPLTEWRTTDLSVSAILASTATELVPVITDTTGIQIIEMKDLKELGIQVEDEVYVASVVAPPVKTLNTAYGPTRDFVVGTKSANRKQEVVFISVPKANETSHLTHKAVTLLNQSAELRKVHSLLQSSSFKPRLRITSTSGTSMRLAESTSVQRSTTSKPSECSVFTCPCGLQYSFTDSICRPITGICNSSNICGVMEGTSEPATKEPKIKESYHVACEAAIKPEMFSKRLTANIHTASDGVSSQFNVAVPNEVTYSDGIIVVPGTNVNQEAQYVPGATNTSDKPVLQVGTQCAVIHRDFAVPDFSKEKLSKGEYTTDSLPHFTHQQANGMALGTLRGTGEASTISQTQKRTHSADSRTQKTEQLCVNCQNKLFMTETSVAEPYDPNSVQPAITIRRSSDVGLFETSQSISTTRASTLRRSFFSRNSEKRLSGSFESLRSQSLTTKCAMCHTDLTSGDLTTSIQTSTSSLLGSEAVVNMSVNEIAEAYVGICRAIGQYGNSAESKERASLYQTLKHNRIIQAVIADYEKDRNKEGQFFPESKEIADVVATTAKQTSYGTSEPSTYSRLRNNTLVKKVVESYETYKHNQGKDSCTQTDPAQLGGNTFASSDVQEIAEVVGMFEKSEGQITLKGALYADLKGNPIIQRVIEEYERNKGVHATTKPRVTRAEAVHTSTAASKVGVLSVDGQVAKMESEKFASADPLTRNGFLIVRRKQKRKAEENPISSSISSDSEDEDIIQNWRPTQVSPLPLEEYTRFDVACSALITPETWDKKVQVDSTYQY